MPLTLTEEQQLLQDSVRGFLDNHSPVSRMRALRDDRDATGFSRDLWKTMAELGWLGIQIPEVHGGAGMGLCEVGIIMTECGRVLAPEPLLSTLLLGANAVRLSTNEALQAEVLPAVAAGERLIAFGLEETGRFNPSAIETAAVSTDAGFSISGQKRYVLNGHTADQLVVVARTSGRPRDREGRGLFLVDADSDGVSIVRTTLMDGRNAADVAFDGVEVGDNRLLGDAELLDRVLDQATLGLAAEMVGMADEAFEQTLQYLKDREQFGVKIGTFQTLRHRAAEMFAELEFARSLVVDGLSAVDEGRDDVSLSASAAKVQANKAARLIGAEGVQMHGGMGMTDELDIGLYFKRLRAADVTLGDESYHLRRFASLQGY